MYIYICTHMYIHEHIYISIFIYMYIYMYIHEYIYIYIYIHIYTFICTYLYVYIYIYIYISVSIKICIKNMLKSYSLWCKMSVSNVTKNRLKTHVYHRIPFPIFWIWPPTSGWRPYPLRIMELTVTSHDYLFLARFDISMRDYWRKLLFL
jgi:hypothetical protein